MKDDNMDSNTVHLSKAHLKRVAASKKRESNKAHKRSPHWASVRDKFIKTARTCAACGGTAELQVHHIEPFNEKPNLELSPSNLIVLCMGPYECHLKIGHGGSYDHFNPNVSGDSAKVLADFSTRKAVEKSARESRLVNKPA
jgi:hypothetical protein